MCFISSRCVIAIVVLLKSRCIRLPQEHHFRLPNLLPTDPIDRRPPQRLANILPISTRNIAGTAIIAHSKVRLHTTAHSLQASLATAVLRMTSDTTTILPHNLTEVSPVLEVAHIRLVEPVVAPKPANFVIVEHIRDDIGDVVWWDAGSDVLAVAAAVDSGVVTVDAAGSDFGGGGGEGRGPGYGGRGVVGAVDVVVVEDGVFVVEGAGLGWVRVAGRRRAT